jgi:hypothetical protein
MQTHSLQQIQGGQQIESIENEKEPGNRTTQPRVHSSKSSSIHNPNLLASLNLLEIRRPCSVSHASSGSMDSHVTASAKSRRKGPCCNLRIL